MTEQPSQAVVIKSEQREITISFNDVKRYLCPLASDAEIGLFLKVCTSENLNPFKRECWLVKYTKDQPAAIIIATEAFTKAAENSPEFDGYEAGIILKPIDPKDKPEFREGSFLMDDEGDRLAGGWARVFRKDRSRPFYSAVNIKECIKYTRYGKPTRFWEEMPATMIRKVALSRALRECFSNRYSGTYTTAEIEPPPEGELPPAYERNGEAYWKLWWARQKEKGLDENDVHDILGVTSVREDWLGTGRTLEEADEVINQALPLVTRAKKLGVNINQVSDMLGMSLKQWFEQGKTVDDAVKVLSEELAKPKAEESAEVGEGFNIDIEWLKDSQKRLKWTDETTLSFITNQYKVGGKSVIEALNKLTREQAEEFVKEINSRLEKQTSLL